MAKKNRVGRPTHKPTRATRDKVQWRKAVGWSRDDIALELGVDRNTLEKHYMVELDTGWVVKRGKVIDMMKRGANAGNASLQKKLLEIIDAANPEWTPRDGEPKNNNTDEKAPANLGKKEIQAEEAKTAGQGTDWADDLTPGHVAKHEIN